MGELSQAQLSYVSMTVQVTGFMDAENAEKTVYGL